MNIVLIGFMGSGKTTISQALSQITKLPAIDMDAIVENKAQLTISEIFNKFGEIRFREMEIDVAKNLKEIENHIIATGGGVVLNKIIIDYLKSNNGVVIFLRTSFEEISKRLSADLQNRPLFKNKKIAKQLYKFRLSMYQQYADITIDTDKKTQNDIALEIISILGL